MDKPAALPKVKQKKKLSPTNHLRKAWWSSPNGTIPQSTNLPDSKTLASPTSGLATNSYMSMASGSKTVYGGNYSFDSCSDKEMVSIVSQLQQISSCLSEAIAQVERNHRKKLARVLTKIQDTYWLQFDRLFNYFLTVQNKNISDRRDQMQSYQNKSSQYEDEIENLKQELAKAKRTIEAKNSLLNVERLRNMELSRDLRELKGGK